ncbi:MAG: hypothetical protein AB7E95_12220, partial [Kiritimatiellales bacterium]
ILASIVHVPIIGISRGSKVVNFLQPFGLTSVGDVDSCDFAALKNEVLRLLRSRTEFEEKSRDVRSRLLHRLNAAIEQLKRLLTD